MSAKSEKALLSIRLDESQFNLLLNTMQEMVRAFAYAQVKNEEDLVRKARFLRVFKLSEQEIADLVGSSQPTIHRALTEGKKKGEKSSKVLNDTTANPKEGS